MDNFELNSEVIHKHERFNLLAIEGKYSKDSFFYAREYRPHQEAQATVLYLHDLGDHVSRHEDFFNALEKSFNYPVQFLMFDYRGHGKSSGNRGHIEKLDQLCFDAFNLINYYKEEIKDHPVYLLASGFGGLVALKMFSEFYAKFKIDISGLILLNPSFKWRGTLPQFRDLIFSKVSLLSKVRVPFYLDGKDISNNSVLAQEFDRDPLVIHRFSWNTFWEFKTNSSELRTSAYYLDIPIFIGISRRDRLYDYTITELFSRVIGDSTIQYYQVRDHDLLHSEVTAILIEDVSNWLDKK